ncbi:orotidine 5'-phosphate decarboxylase [Candidatus Parcubacteria bacterium]|nr:orotidine 5'-phosphate decarboxylase [Candidatus Parcubacteria bacterium]
MVKDEMNKRPEDMIMVALDGFTSPEEAIDTADQIGKGNILGFKANSLLDICLVTGFPLVDLVAELKKVAPLFWADQKFSDVQNTVFDRITPYRAANVDLITVMAGDGGVPMIRKAIQSGGEQIEIIGVTVLTDRIEEDAYLDLGAPVRAKVLQYARNVVLAGGKKLVCSGLELEFLGKFPELDVLDKIIPAIRPEWAAKKGQVRITTPTMAIENGAAMLVIGSPVCSPPSEIGTPSDAVQKILEEIEKTNMTG